VALFAQGFAWNRYLALARVMLAAAAIAVTHFRGEEVAPVWWAIPIVYLAYAALAAVLRHVRPGGFGLLALFGDTVFFLILAISESERSLWLAAVFYLFLMVQATVFYGAREVVVVAGITALFCGLAPDSSARLLERTVLVAGVLASGFAVGRQRLQAKLEEQQRELEEARGQAAQAAETERQRIASDFHDGPLQSFISLQMRLEILRKLLDRDFNAGMNDLRQLHDLALSQVRELRAFLRSMRPVEVEGANFLASARRAAEAFQKESGIPVTFVGTDAKVTLPQETTPDVLQMLGEALRNVQKHAGATRVAVAVEKTDHEVEISVDDNGHGFPFAGAYSLEELELLRLGPASLKRRARALNADFMLESRPGRGTGLKFRIPLP
jgi:signal transduction histidine kinase